MIKTMGIVALIIANMALLMTNMDAQSVIERQRKSLNALQTSTDAVLAEDMNLKEEAQELQTAVVDQEQSYEALQRQAVAAIQSIAEDNDRLVEASQHYRATCERALKGKFGALRETKNGQ